MKSGIDVIRFTLHQFLDRGRKGFSPSPPSEPCMRFSRTRLSSRWFQHRDRHANAWSSVMVKSPYFLTPARVTSRTGLPVYRTMPSDHSISNHLTYPCHSFITLPISSAGPLPKGTGFALLPASSPVSPGRIEFVILQTGRSPPVAPHPASRRRSYLRLQARRAIDLKRTFTSLTSCAHGRTGSGFQPRSCNHVYRATFTKPSEPNQRKTRLLLSRVFL